MLVNGKHYRTIWIKEGDNKTVQIIDQRRLPHKFVVEELKTVDDIARAIKEMHIRGAGLIGAAAAYGMYLAALEASGNSFDDDVEKAGEKLKSTRPTAVNLKWAVELQKQAMKIGETPEEKAMIAFETAKKIADEDANFCRRIGEHGLKIIEEISKKKGGEVVNILTHCNAGWLAFVDYGSATAPIYAAHDNGIKVHVWVDETRPRNQGAKLTAWELGQHCVPHTIIADNVGGHLMQHGMVDMVITGADRVTYTGDAANKIGTYLKALAAQDNNIPFYIALPSSTFDWEMRDGIKEIPIEERDGDEVTHIEGLHEGEIKKVLITPEKSNATNFGFDVTPSRLITGLITERGIMGADENSILKMYPDKIKGSNGGADAGATANNEGVIKFKKEVTRKDAVEESIIAGLMEWRDRLYNKGLIGEDDDGIGFGNVSQRDLQDFIITGSQTGGIKSIRPEHFCTVTSVDLKSNSVKAEGPIDPSSECMTHSIIYSLDPKIMHVFHAHCPELWQKREELGIPATPEYAKFGTAEMAEETRKLWEDDIEVEEKGIIAMGGHEDGIVTFGRTAEEAGERMLFYLKMAKSGKKSMLIKNKLINRVRKYFSI